MKIVQLTTENFKRISVVQITPDGAIVEINGRNGQGKSSVIDSIAAAIGGEKLIPEKPVRRGTGHAKIVCELDDLIVTRSFVEDGKSTLTLTTRDGTRIQTPQAILDRLCGRLTFDPLAFTRLDSKKQAETLRQLVGLDFSTEDGERKELYDQRADLNREVKQMQGHLEALPHWPDGPKDEVRISDLTVQLGKVNEANMARQKLVAEIRRSDDQIGIANANIENLKGQLATCVDTLGKWEQYKLKQQDQLAKTVEEDTSELQRQISESEVNNQKVRENTTRAELHSLIESKQEDSKALSQAIEEIDQMKLQKLAEAPFPVPGLGFDESGVIFMGMPFSQCSSAEQMRISVSMGLTMNPKLRILLIKDGSLLDSQSLAMIGEMAQKADAQVWIERVTDGTGTGVVIEDGAVALQVPEI